MNMTPVGGCTYYGQPYEGTPPAELSAAIGETRYTVKDSGLSYRTINHWMSEGLLKDHRREPSGWRKLSLRDILWLNVLREVREFGLSIEQMRQAYTTLKPASKSFEAAIALCFQSPPVPVFIIVLADGTSEAVPLLNLRAKDYSAGYERSFIRISLNSLCAKLLGDNEVLQPNISAEDLLMAEKQNIRKTGPGSAPTPPASSPWAILRKASQNLAPDSKPEKPRAKR